MAESRRGNADALRGTVDGISGDDWNEVHELSLALCSTIDTDEENSRRLELLTFLQRLDRKYGKRASLLAARADFISDNDLERRRLYEEAYQIALRNQDPFNLLYVAHSMAELCVEAGDHAEVKGWLARFRSHLDSVRDEFYEIEYERLVQRANA